jgi:hypothetical protein
VAEIAKSGTEINSECAAARFILGLKRPDRHVGLGPWHHWICLRHDTAPSRALASAIAKLRAYLDVGYVGSVTVVKLGLSS